MKHLSHVLAALLAGVSIHGMFASRVSAAPPTPFPTSLPGTICTHYAPPGQGCFPSSSDVENPCSMPPASNHEYSLLKDNDWHPIGVNNREKADVVFIFRGYGGTSLFGTQEDLRSYRSRQLKQVIMSALSENSAGNIRRFNAIDAGIDNRDEKEVVRESQAAMLQAVLSGEPAELLERLPDQYRRPNEEQLSWLREALSYLEGSGSSDTSHRAISLWVNQQNDSEKTSFVEVYGSSAKNAVETYIDQIVLPENLHGNSRVYMVILSSVTDAVLSPWQQNDLYYPLRLRDGSTVKAAFVTFSAQRWFDSREWMGSLGQRLSEAKDKAQLTIAGLSGVITQRLFYALGMESTTFDTSYQDPSVSAEDSGYGEFSVMRVTATREDAPRLMESDSVSMMDKIIWFGDYGYSTSMITKQAQPLCDTDNATNMNAPYVLDLGQRVFMEVNKGRCVKYVVYDIDGNFPETASIPLSVCLENGVADGQRGVVDGIHYFRSGNTCFQFVIPDLPLLSDSNRHRFNRIRMSALSEEDQTICSIINPNAALNSSK